MKNIVQAFILGIMFLGLVGCNKTLSEEENTLLNSMRIEDADGDKQLSDEEEEVLKQYDFVKEYLDKKYGNRDDIKFNIVTPENEDQDYTYFACTLISNPGIMFDVNIYEEDDKYIVSDNYYGHLMKDSYNAFVKNKITKLGYQIISTDLILPELYGEEFTKDLTIEKAISEGKSIYGVGTLKFDKTEDNKTIIKGLQKLKEDGITGNFLIEIDGSDESEWVNMMKE